VLLCRWLVPFLEAKRIGTLGKIDAVSSACLAVASPAAPLQR
jgi:hypothetical protein